MKQRKIIIITTAILLAGIIGTGYYRHYLATPKPTAANAVVTTGLSIRFDAPLQTSAVAKVTDSAGKTVLAKKLEAKGQQFNLTLTPGVYRVNVTPADQPPTAPTTVTVSAGRLAVFSVALTQPDE